MWKLKRHGVKMKNRIPWRYMHRQKRRSEDGSFSSRILFWNEHVVKNGEAFSSKHTLKIDCLWRSLMAVPVLLILLKNPIPLSYTHTDYSLSRVHRTPNSGSCFSLISTVFTAVTTFNSIHIYSDFSQWVSHMHKEKWVKNILDLWFKIKENFGFFFFLMRHIDTHTQKVK